ncbi:hypothetical protein OHR68_19695 [Spirillospora sp. NBC_00431]
MTTLDHRRRLHIQPAPPRELASAWMLVHGDTLYRAWRSATPPASGGPPNLHCRLVHRQTIRRTLGWVSHNHGPYQGEPADRVLLTTRHPDTDLLRPQATVQLIDQAQRSDQRHWEQAGVLHQPADEPDWLRASLIRYTWQPTPLVADARQPWQAPIHTCTLMHDGRTLRLEGIMGWGEVLSKIQLSEQPDEVGVLATVGIDPQLVPRHGPSLRARPGLAQQWRAIVHLSAPLRQRPVLDLSHPDSTSNASHSWDRWHRGPIDQDR